LLFVPVIAATFLPETISDRLLAATPMSAGLAVQSTVSGADVSIGPWAGLGVLWLYALVTLTAAWWLIPRRDT
jgi:ABC-2 type transport system permease protein